VIETATLAGDASEEQLAELRELFQTKTHSPMWRASNFAYIAAIKARGENVTAVLAETLARFLREQEDLPPYEPATGADYDQLHYALDRREVPEPFFSWLFARVDKRDLSHAYAQLVLIDLAKLPRKARRGHIAPTGIPATEIPDGYYAIGDGDTARCYSLKTKDGRQVLRWLNFEARSRPEVRDAKRAARILDAIAADLNASQRLFAETAHRCTACSRPIEPDDSNPGFPHGYGPDCWREIQRSAAATLPLSTDPEASNA
jgi:hypothetical protein